MSSSQAFTKKIRAAIKLKIEEFGIDADDELPDYVMVLAANRKEKHQMKTDLQLFLGKHTEIFVEWLFEAFNRMQNDSSDAPEKKDSSCDDKVETSSPDVKHRRSPSVEELLPQPARAKSPAPRLRSQVVVVSTRSRTAESPRRKESSSRSERNRSYRNDDNYSRSRNAQESEGTRRRSSVERDRYRDSASRLSKGGQNGRHNETTRIPSDEEKPSKPKRSFSPKIHYDEEHRAGTSGNSKRTNEEEILTVSNDGNKDTDPIMRRFTIRVGNREICRTVSLSSSDQKRRSPEGDVQRRKRHADDPARVVSRILNAQNIGVSSAMAARLDRFGKENNAKRARIQERSSDYVEPYSPAPLKKSNESDDEQRIDEFLTKMKSQNSTVQQQQAIGAFHAANTSAAPAQTHYVEMVRAERCKFWPDCAKTPGECQYHHPTRLCTKFPHCVFGVQCLNIHPMCKFGSSCSKPNCIFTHSLKKKPEVTSFTQRTHLASTAESTETTTEVNISQIPCKFKNRCTRLGCAYLHPKDCRYGLVCSSSTCPFMHRKPDLSKYKWTAAGDC